MADSIEGTFEFDSVLIVREKLNVTCINWTKLTDDKSCRQFMLFLLLLISD